MIKINKLIIPSTLAMLVAVLALFTKPAVAHQDYTRAGSELKYKEIESKHVDDISVAKVWTEGDNFISAALIGPGEVSKFKAKGERHWLVVEGEIQDPFGSGETLGPGAFFTNPSNNKMQIACVYSGPCVLHHYSRVARLKLRNPGIGPINQKGAVSIPFTVSSSDSWPAKIFPFGLAAGAWLSPVQGELFATDYGTMMFFPEGFSPETVTGTDAHWHSDAYTGVVIMGSVRNPFFDPAGGLVREDTVLGPGDHWFVPAGAIHTTICDSPGGCIGFFRGSHAFDFNPIDFVGP